MSDGAMRQDRAPNVVFVRFQPRDRVQSLLVALGFVGIGVFIMYVVGYSSALPRDQTSLVVSLSCFLMAAGSFAVVVYRTIRLRNMRAKLNSSMPTRCGRRRAIEAFVNLGKMERGIFLVRKFRWKYDRALRSLQSMNISLPVCIVDAKLRKVVRGCQRTEELLECEPVGQTMEKAHSMGYFLSGGALLVSPWVLSWIITGRGWSGCAFIIISFVGLCLMSVAIQRWFVTGEGSLARARGFIVGPGGIGKPGHVWRTDECLTVIRRDRGKIRVTVCDRAGTVSLKYLESPPDSFQEFWVRWMHPKPRPDLVAAMYQ